MKEVTLPKTFFVVPLPGPPAEILLVLVCVCVCVWEGACSRILRILMWCAMSHVGTHVVCALYIHHVLSCKVPCSHIFFYDFRQIARSRKKFAKWPFRHIASGAIRQTEGIPCFPLKEPIRIFGELLF